MAAFIKAAADKMESRHLTILGIAVVLILATGYFGGDAFKAYVASEAASRDLETHSTEITKLSEQETQRAKILGALAANSEQMRDALLQVQASYQTILRTAATGDQVRILDVQVPQDVAKELVSNPRRPGEGSRLDGKYEVLDIERHDQGVFSITLKPPGDVNAVTAEARSLFVPDDQIDLLLASLKTGRELNIMLNAWKRDDKVISAEVVRVDPAQP